MQKVIMKVLLYLQHYLGPCLISLSQKQVTGMASGWFFFLTKHKGQITLKQKTI